MDWAEERAREICSGNEYCMPLAPEVAQALRYAIDLGVSRAYEAAASSAAVGSATLMREIILREIEALQPPE